MNLPSANKTFSSSNMLERVRTMRDMNVPDSLKERVASVLASEFSKKVECIGVLKRICLENAVAPR